MGFIKEAKANNMAGDAKRAAEEGRTVFVAQFRGAVSHSPSLSRPIGGVAEMIEAVEAEGWRVDQFTAFPYKDNMTVAVMFRRAMVPQPLQLPQQAQQYGPSASASWGSSPQ